MKTPAYTIRATIKSRPAARWPWFWIAVALFVLALALVVIGADFGITITSQLVAFALGHAGHQRLRADDYARLHITKIEEPTA